MDIISPTVVALPIIALLIIAKSVIALSIVAPGIIPLPIIPVAVIAPGVVPQAVIAFPVVTSGIIPLFIVLLLPPGGLSAGGTRASVPVGRENRPHNHRHAREHQHYNQPDQQFPSVQGLHLPHLY